MYLTISKKFEISCSHRLFNSNWSDEKNLVYYGNESRGEFGHGHNFDVTFIFNGPINEKTGMVINVSEIKERISVLLNEKYDHKFLNMDAKPFDKIIPTPENITCQLLSDAENLFENHSVNLVACHLGEESDIDVTAYRDNKINRRFYFNFSAARRTYSPNLSEEENMQLFGKATNKSGHGHHYKVKCSLEGYPDSESGSIRSEAEIKKILNEIYKKYDHNNLNTDINELINKPITSEILCRQLFNEISANLKIKKLKLNENDYFFIEYDDKMQFKMGIKSSFHAAHRLSSELLSAQEITEIYSNCANPNGHGHKYKVEMVLDGKLDEQSGIMYNLSDITQRLEKILSVWNYKHLDLETDDFKNMISTGENIVSVLWHKLNNEFDNKLFLLSLWETNNNCFTIRRSTK